MKPAIFLTRAAVAGPAGRGADAHLAACLAQLSALRPDAFLTAPGPDGAFEPVIRAPCDGLYGDDPATRIALLLEAALEQMSLEAEGPVLVEILLPGESSLRGEFLDTETLWDQLRDLQPSLMDVALSLVRAEAGAIARLRQRLDELAAGEWGAVIFGGADSLVDAPSILELARAERVLTRTSGQGLAPGETAALLRFERSASPEALRIADLAYGREPHAGQAETCRLTELERCITQVLSQRSASQPAAVWLDLEAETAGSLEWQQIRRRLWQPRLEGDLHHAVELGLVEAPELDSAAPPINRPHRVFGELGAAALPMKLALALAHCAYARRWQSFGFPAPGLALVLETGSDGARGAVCLQPAS